VKRYLDLLADSNVELIKQIAETAAGVKKCVQTEGLSSKCINDLKGAIAHHGLTFLYTNIMILHYVVVSWFNAIKGCILGGFLLQ